MKQSVLVHLPVLALCALPVSAITVTSIDAICGGSALCATQSINTGDLRILAVADTTPSTQTQGDFGEACVRGFCGGGSGPQVSPFTFSLTSASFLCFGNGTTHPCNPFSVSFSLFGSELAAGTPMTVSLSGSVANGFLSTSFLPISGNFHAQVSDQSGIHLDQVDLPFSIQSPGAFSLAAPTIFLTSSGIFHLDARLDVQQMDLGVTFNLPSSATIRFSDQPEIENPTAAPEPATLLLSAGVLLAIRLRKSIVN